MKIVLNRENKSCAIKFTAEENGKILGRAYLYILYNDLHKEPFGFMEDVFVEEESRGRGIGTKLINGIIAEAKKENCYKLICTSRYENVKVHALYDKLGFKDHGKEFRIDL